MKNLSVFLITTYVILSSIAPSYAACLARNFPYVRNNQGLVLQLRINSCNPKLEGIYDHSGNKYKCTNGINNCTRI